MRQFLCKISSKRKWEWHDLLAKVKNKNIKENTLSCPQWLWECSVHNLHSSETGKSIHVSRIYTDKIWINITEKGIMISIVHFSTKQIMMYHGKTAESPINIFDICLIDELWYIKGFGGLPPITMLDRIVFERFTIIEIHTIIKKLDHFSSYSCLHHDKTYLLYICTNYCFWGM